MAKTAKPLLIIVVAIAVAAGAAFILSRESTSPADTAGSSGAPQANMQPGGGQFKGPANARITLVEFGDYQCGSCGYYHPIVTELLRRYPNDLRLEFHHFPLIQIHQYAMPAAMAAEAAGAQGKFWEMHDLIFENQQTWANSRNPEPDFLAYATRIGLDINKFMQDMRAPAVQQRVLADVVRAREINVNETPSFFIGGRRVANPLPGTVDNFAQIIEAELKNAQ